MAGGAASRKSNTNAESSQYLALPKVCDVQGSTVEILEQQPLRSACLIPIGKRRNKPRAPTAGKCHMIARATKCQVSGTE
jgi:hypothetical protein